MIYDEVLNSNSDIHSISEDSSVTTYIEELKEIHEEQLNSFKEDLEAQKCELNQWKKQVDDLIKESKLKDEEILKLSEELKNDISKKQNAKKLKHAWKVYNKKKKEKATFDEDFCYWIDMNEKNDLEILEYTSEARFPFIYELRIVYPPLFINNKLEKLLKYSFPNNLKQFNINWFNNTKLMSDYMEALTSVISRTVTRVGFYYPRLNYDEFSELVIASKHVEILIFKGLTFENNGTINFGINHKYSIKQFSLQWTGDASYSDWKSDKTAFNCIVDQIKNSGMDQELQKFIIYRCNVNADEVKLPNVQVTEEDYL